MILPFTRVALYGARGPVVALVETPVEAAAMQPLAARTGATRTVFLAPPRRDDCELRARIFSPARELPRAAEATLAVARRYERAVALEEGVTRALARPAPDGRFETDAPPPVLGALDLHDPALAAAALGLAADELDPALPVRAGSCGPNVLLVPLRSLDALARAELDLDAWQRTIEKARHLGALALVAPDGGATVRARFFTPHGEEPGNGLAACAAALLLAKHGRALTTRFAFDDEATLEVELASGAAEAWSATVRGEVRHLGVARLDG